MWEKGKEEKKIDQVSWTKIYKSKELGSLDIKDLQTFNQTLISKWKCRFVMEYT